MSHRVHTTGEGILNVADIRRCKFLIMEAEHYRPDGTCRCDDAEHRKMMQSEWDYTAEDFEDIPLRIAK